VLLEDLSLKLNRLDIEQTRIRREIAELQHTVIVVGDRVRISNLTFSVYHDNIESDSLGTVTRVTKKRICIRTDNGELTNRIRKNVTKI
jgi:hypothetical protein